MSLHEGRRGRADSGRSTAPRVSIVSTFLNAERFIAEAIDSVLAQDFQDFELILVDDGSTRECTDIARAYAARYAPVIRYFDHEGHRNRGISASRNLGVALARGEFVAFIDADDVWEPTKLAEQVAILDARPELGMVCGAVRYWRSWAWAGGNDIILQTGHVANVVVPPPEAALALYPLGSAASPCPSDLLLRRELVNTLGGFEEHFTGARQLYEDQGFLAKLYLAAPVYFSDRIWIRYREHADSCTARTTRAGCYDEVRLYFLTWLARYLAERPNADRRVRRALRRSFRKFRHRRVYAAARRSSEILETGWRAAVRILNGAG
jgi:glycosyltransferase involved in cell wall biosynthesis